MLISPLEIRLTVVEVQWLKFLGSCSLAPNTLKLTHPFVGARISTLTDSLWSSEGRPGVELIKVLPPGDFSFV